MVVHERTKLLLLISIVFLEVGIIFLTYLNNRPEEIAQYVRWIDEWNRDFNKTLNERPTIQNEGQWESSSFGPLPDDPSKDNGKRAVPNYKTSTFVLKGLDMPSLPYDLSRLHTMSIMNQTVVFPFFLETTSGCFVARELCMIYPRLANCWGSYSESKVFWDEVTCTPRQNVQWNFANLTVRLFPANDPFIRLGIATRGSWKFAPVMPPAERNGLGWIMLSLGICFLLLGFISLWLDRRQHMVSSNDASSQSGVAQEAPATQV